MVTVILKNGGTIQYSCNDDKHIVSYVVNHESHIVDVRVANAPFGKIESIYTVATFSLDEIIGISDIGTLDDEIRKVLSESLNLFPN